MESNITTIGFSDLIRNYRKEKKLTQAAFGKLIDRSQVTVSNYEKKIHFPENPEELKAIAALLNQPVSYVIDSIEYSRSGTIKEHEAMLIDLDKLSEEDLVKKYNFRVEGEEVTGEVLAKMLELVKYEHYKNKQNKQ